MTWKYFGDRRGLFFGVWIGVLQNMHPQLAAGVEQHSTFLDERWERALRSFYPVLGVVYDGPRARETARQVVGYHHGVKGIDARGHRYHALNRDPFYWAHATFVMANLVISDRFGTPFTDEQKDRLCQEAIQWYRLYGLPTHGLPADWAGFRSYWDNTCANILEDCRAARDVLDIAHIAKPPIFALMPRWLWRTLWIPTSYFLSWTTVGLLPTPVRERLGLPWSDRDAWLLRLLGKAVAMIFNLIPFDLRYHPRARAGWRRERGAIPATASLVHTPARNLPPVARRAHPSHYCPIPAPQGWISVPEAFPVPAHAREQRHRATIAPSGTARLDQD
jgi:uncharacterized protein (DUF2236 family)